MNRKDIIDYYDNSDIEQPSSSPIRQGKNIGIIALIVAVHLIGVGCVIGLTPTKDLFTKDLFSKADHIPPQDPSIAEQPQPIASSTPTPKPTPAPPLPKPVPPATIAAPAPPPAEKIIQQQAIVAAPNPVKTVSSNITTTNQKGLVKTYVVQQGDTVTKIAKKFRLSTKRLVEINNIKDPNKLRVGQILRFM